MDAICFHPANGSEKARRRRAAPGPAWPVRNEFRSLERLRGASDGRLLPTLRRRCRQCRSAVQRQASRLSKTKGQRRPSRSHPTQSCLPWSARWRAKRQPKPSRLPGLMRPTPLTMACGNHAGGAPVDGAARPTTEQPRATRLSSALTTAPGRRVDSSSESWRHGRRSL